MPRKDKIDQLYRKHTGMILNRVQTFHATSGVDFDDLLSEADGAFMYAIAKWDGKRPFGTWLHWQLNGFLLNAIRKITPPDEFDLQLIPTRQPDPFQSLCWKEKMEHLLHSLSEEAAHVARLILEGPVEALGLLGTEPPKAIRGAIHRYLLERGLSHSKSWAVLRELQEAVR